MKALSPPLFQELEEELNEARAKNLLRELRTCTAQEARSGIVNGRSCVLFSTNNYLGLSHDPRLVKRAQEVLADQGVGAGASRLLSGSSDWHARLEQSLAEWKNKEAALVFSSGYAANLGVLSALAGPKDLVVMDKLNHASLIDGARLSQATVRIYPHLDLERLEEILRRSDGFRRRLIVTDTVFSMDGDVAPLRELIALKHRYEAILVVDEAHATGVFGPKGEGVAEEQGVESEIDVSIGTLSKALGTLGGFVVGSQMLIQYLINHARSFIFSTALPSALAAAAWEAVQIVQNEPALRERLWQNARFVKTELTKLGLNCGASPSPILPILVGEAGRAVALSRFFFERGLYVPAVRPPAVGRGKSRLRLSLSAAHTPEDLEHLLALFRKAREEGYFVC